VEHPFFVCDKGWSACVPDKSLQKFSLHCNPLNVGDVCIFLSPNTIPTAATLSSIPQGQIAHGRPQASTVTLTTPEQIQQSTVLNQINVPVEDPPSTAGLSANTLAQKQGQSSIAVPVQTQMLSVAQPSTLTMTTTNSQFSTPSAIPAGSTLIYDPQFGVLRPQHLTGQPFLNQQVIGTTIDGKTVPVQGALPPFYQTLPASLVSSLPTQTFVQSPNVPAGQAGVGNGLLVTAVGIVPGQQGMRMGQPSMIYASQLSEMAHKQGHDTMIDSGQVSNTDTEQKADSQTDVGPPEAKRAKTDGQ
jgi:hypothetical protein